jgi:hypothetical protein
MFTQTTGISTVLIAKTVMFKNRTSFPFEIVHDMYDPATPIHMLCLWENGDFHVRKNIACFERKSVHV